MPWHVEYNGYTYELPSDFNHPPSRRTARLPDEVLFEIDERSFDRMLGNNAVWVKGQGPYLLLAWCGAGLTVSRWDNLMDAIEQKHWIDDLACGSGCIGAHMIGQCGPGNPGYERGQQAIGEYIKTHNLKSTHRAPGSDEEDC